MATTFALMMGGLAVGAAAARYVVRNPQLIPKINLKPSGPRFSQGGFQPKMTPDEAAKILSVRSTSSKETIIAAHRRIMLLNHPDNGGSTYVATKINEAKDMLLKEKN